MIKEMIVVEGKTDIDFLSTFLDADFYSVNGSAVSKEDIDYLKKVNEIRGIIVLTDPDYPGLQIRNKIKKNIPTAKHAFVSKEKSIKHHKVGVAESTKEEVNKALKNLITFVDKSQKDIKISDLYEFGLCGKSDSSLKRHYLCDKLNIGYSNGKSLCEKLNSIKITKKEIKDIINAYN
ncbi:MAG: ribonuclease M5 [Bacilli bacterium]